MEMEVVVPIHHNMDFDLHGGRSSPIHHLSTPTTPKGFQEFYCSAPTSPNRLSQFYREFDEFLMMSKENISEKGTYSAATVPFDWEEKPGMPKSAKAAATKDEDDFAFDVGNDFETASLSAEELFDGGVIKTLKPPPRLQLPAAARISGTSSIISPSPTSTISQSKKIVMGAFSPGHKKESTLFISSPQKTNQRSPGHERGRERSPAGLKSSSRRATRSLSPLRVSQYPWEQDEEQNSQQQKNRTESSIIAKVVANSAASALASFCQGYKKWRLKDFFLFRSASEGRTADKDPLRKYTAAIRRYEDVRTSSMRSIDSISGSVSSRRRGPVSAHELHYTVNKAVSEDLKKRTFLPYKQGILGRLAFNPAVHALANGFGLSHK